MSNLILFLSLLLLVDFADFFSPDPQLVKEPSLFLLKVFLVSDALQLLLLLLLSGLELSDFLL